MPTRKTKAAERGGAPPRVVLAGSPAPLTRRAVLGAVELVLTRERWRGAVSLSFVGPRAMRNLNRRWKGVDRPTDVLAFSLVDGSGGRWGDCYLCPAVARANARTFGVPPREELLRVIIHATLHALGYDHPEGAGRTRSAMWRKQERYLGCVT